MIPFVKALKIAPKYCRMNEVYRKTSWKKYFNQFTKEDLITMNKKNQIVNIKSEVLKEKVLDMEKPKFKQILWTLDNVFDSGEWQKENEALH